MCLCLTSINGHYRYCIERALQQEECNGMASLIRPLFSVIIVCFRLWVPESCRCCRMRSLPDKNLTT